MPKTWQSVSREVLGYVETQTPKNEEYVAVMKIQKLIDEGHSDYDIALIWNGSLAGSEKPIIKKGHNKWGVAFNTKAYADSITNIINQ